MALSKHAQYSIHRAQIEKRIAEFTFTCDNPVEEAVTYYAGVRCPDYEPLLCASCRTWKAYDDLVGRSKGWVG